MEGVKMGSWSSKSRIVYGDFWAVILKIVRTPVRGGIISVCNEPAITYAKRGGVGEATTSSWATGGLPLSNDRGVPKVGFLILSRACFAGPV